MELEKILEVESGVGIKGNILNAMYREQEKEGEYA
jgi:hypothetical protein